MASSCCIRKPSKVDHRMEGDLEPVLHEDPAARFVGLDGIAAAQQKGACGWVWGEEVWRKPRPPFPALLPRVLATTHTDHVRQHPLDIHSLHAGGGIGRGLASKKGLAHGHELRCPRQVGQLCSGSHES
eukprot:scaffold10890_cov135-Isochrysis_galbana.AAC.2